ncbi:ATP-dependent RNA helicase DDX24 [Osmerus mordax]|uniref:ATP-dependent RNA helicase DDX24 n=1 Tax=Osmerus mordax TaxID=8014 RepID=UPI0035105BA1
MKTKGIQNKRPSSGKKSLKRGIRVKGTWKAIDVDPSFFSEEGMGGLVCFEELTDYRLIDPTKAEAAAEKEALKKEKRKERRKAKKRKARGEEAVGDEQEAVGDEQEAVGDEQEAVGNEKETGVEIGEKEETSDKPPKKKRKKKLKELPEGDRRQPDSSAGDEVKSEAQDQDERKENSEQSVEESASKEVDVVPEKAAPTQPGNAKSKKRKRNRKKKRQLEKPTEVQNTDEQTEAEETDLTSQTTTKPPPQEKVAVLSKKKQKNWTNAGLSGSSEQCADVSAWKDLFVPATVLEALSSLGFGSPTPIQALVLPSAIRDQMDIVGAAETGSGKTLSFAIPMIHTILEWKKGSETPDEDGAEVPAEAPWESLYLPTLETAGEGSGETGAAVSTETRDESAVPGSEEASEGEEEGTAEEGEGMAEPEEDDTQDPDSVCVDNDANQDEEEEGESGDEQMGCVKVIEDVDFDFDDTAEDKEALKASQNQPLLGLVLAPTRELAVQVKHHIDAVAKFTGIRTAIVVGGMAQQKQVRMLKRRPEIVIATPGRLWELIKEKHPHLVNLRQIRCLVIDEADRMVERGHFAELESLLEMLNTIHFNPKRQTFVFSATLTMAHSLPTRVLQKKGRRLDQRSKIETLMDRVGIKSKPKVIDLTRKEATVESLTETRIHCSKEEKDFFLYYFLLQYPGRTMVFANSIDCIKRLNSLLVILEITPLPLHANMHQKQRLKNLERFAERESSVLLTTDVAARGLDIPNVQHVIHYQVPRTSETYVHRSGRTARAAKEGLSLLLVGPDDMMNFKKIYRALGKDEELPVFPVQSNCMAAIKERVNMARKIEKEEYHNSKEKQHNSWFQQAAEALEVDLDEDLLLGGRKDEEDERQQQKMVKGMKRHLKHLLSQPVFKNVMKTRYPTQMGKLSLPQLPLAGVETALTSVSIQRKKQKLKKKTSPVT